MARWDRIGWDRPRRAGCALLMAAALLGAGFLVGSQLSAMTRDGPAEHGQGPLTRLALDLATAILVLDAALERILD